MLPKMRLVEVLGGGLVPEPLIAASVLVGVLLAVIGQVYHTGADAYSLFAAWTLLILPWTLASRSAARVTEAKAALGVEGEVLDAADDRAVEAFPDAEMIYERNMETLRKLGLAGWLALGLHTPEATRNAGQTDGQA